VHFCTHRHKYSQKTNRDKSLAAELYAGLEYYYGNGAIRKHFLRNAEFQTRGNNKE
jgi:hypothetical protein